MEFALNNGRKRSLSHERRIAGSWPHEEIHKAEDDQAEASRLRVAWMTELGFDGHAIEVSLRYNRPQSVEEERYLLDAVRKLTEAQKEQERFVMENAPN